MSVRSEPPDASASRPQPGAQPAPKPKRRRLDFRDFDAVIAEVERLRDHGYDAAGRWNLAQICDHLARAFDGSIDGFRLSVPKALVIMTGPLVKPLVLKTRRLPAGVSSPPGFSPPPDARLDEAVANLNRAIDRFRDHQGPVAFHPAFGQASHEDWTQSHLIHCSHHLGFLSPRTA